MSSHDRSERLRPDFVWTEALEAEVLRRVVDGESAGMIALALGCTRNAVIGKIHRLAKRKGPDGSPLYPHLLPGRPAPKLARLRAVAEPDGRKGGIRGARKARAKSLVKATHVAGAGNGLAFAISRARAAARQGDGGGTALDAILSTGTQAGVRKVADGALPGDAWAPLPGTVPVLFETIPLHGVCKWMVEAAELEGFHCCGAPAEPGKPWCAVHAERARGKPAPAKIESATGFHQQRQRRPSRADVSFTL